MTIAIMGIQKLSVKKSQSVLVFYILECRKRDFLTWLYFALEGIYYTIYGLC